MTKEEWLKLATYQSKNLIHISTFLAPHKTNQLLTALFKQQDNLIDEALMECMSKIQQYNIQTKSVKGLETLRKLCLTYKDWDYK